MRGPEGEEGTPRPINTVTDMSNTPIVSEQLSEAVYDAYSDSPEVFGHMRDALLDRLAEPTEATLFAGYEAYAADLGDDEMTGQEKVANVIRAVVVHIKSGGH